MDKAKWNREQDSAFIFPTGDGKNGRGGFFQFACLTLKAESSLWSSLITEKLLIWVGEASGGFGPSCALPLRTHLSSVIRSIWLLGAFLHTSCLLVRLVEAFKKPAIIRKDGPSVSFPRPLSKKVPPRGSEAAVHQRNSSTFCQERCSVLQITMPQGGEELTRMRGLKCWAKERDADLHDPSATGSKACY